MLLLRPRPDARFGQINPQAEPTTWRATLVGCVCSAAHKKSRAFTSSNYYYTDCHYAGPGLPVTHDFPPGGSGPAGHGGAAMRVLVTGGSGFLRPFAAGIRAEAQTMGLAR